MTALKDLFFVCSADTVDAFCNGLKPRCIKVSEKFQTLHTEYGEEKVLYNSEDDTYITPHMEVYRLDTFLNELQPADTFKEIKVNELQAERAEGARYRTFKYVLSDKALKSQTFLLKILQTKGRISSETMKTHSFLMMSYSLTEEKQKNLMFSTRKYGTGTV